MHVGINVDVATETSNAEFEFITTDPEGRIGMFLEV